MHITPIALLPSSKLRSYDDSGTEVVKGVAVQAGHPPYHPEVLRQRQPHFLPATIFTFVPPLAFYCIQVILEDLQANSRHAFLDKLPQRPVPCLPPDPGAPDLIQMLIPHIHRASGAARWKCVDPRLWVFLINYYQAETLPSPFLEYALPLSDPYLPYMQFLEPADRFTFVTVLDLSKQASLTDETIIELRSLHQLSVLDMSGTTITSRGVKKLEESLQLDDDFPKGLWKLRIISLKGTHVNNDVVLSLRRFPLLSVVDLRSCRHCQDRVTIHGWSDIIDSDKNTDLFESPSLSERLSALRTLAQSRHSDLFLSISPHFTLSVDQLKHPPPPVQNFDYTQGSAATSVAQRFPEEGGYAVTGPQGTGFGNLDALEKRRKAQEDAKELVNVRTIFPKLSFKQFDADQGPARNLGEDDTLEAQVQRQQALEAIRTSVHREYLSKLEEAAKSKEMRYKREEVSRGRDPSALTDLERRNRHQVVIRFPPPYAALQTAVKKERQLQAIKATQAAERQKEATKARPAPVITVNKKSKRGIGELDIWSTISSEAGQPPTKSSRLGGSSTPSGTERRNPFSKAPAKDPRKIVRREQP